MAWAAAACLMFAAACVDARRRAGLSEQAGEDRGRLRRRLGVRPHRARDRQKLGEALKQPFVVEVRPGAGANVATQSVVRSPKDGYTLLVATSSSTIRGPQSANFNFDFGADLAPVALIANVPFVLTAYPGLGVKTVKEFIALAKAKPEGLTFGGTQVGTTGHLAAQLFNQRAGTNLVIAPYPSTAQATTDLMTGRISVAFATASNVLQLIGDNKLTALAVAQSKRSALIPDVPSIDGGRTARRRFQHLDRDAGAGRNAARDRRSAVEDGERGVEVRGSREADAALGHGAARRNPGRIRPPHQGGYGAMGCGAGGVRARQVAAVAPYFRPARRKC